MSIVRTLAAATIGMLLGAVLVCAASPVSAVGPDRVEVSAPDGVVYERCLHYRYHYAIDASEHPAWDAVAVFENPRGIKTGRDYLDSRSDPDSGRGTGLFCPEYDRVGQYQITVNVTFYDSNGDVVEDEYSTDLFRLRKPRTRTTFTISDLTPRYNQIVTFRVAHKIEGPRGYYQLDYEDVALEARRDGTWKRIHGSKESSNGRGVAIVKGRWNRRAPLAVRAATLTTPIFLKSVSRAKTIS